METTIEQGRDEVFGKDYTVLIIKERFGFYLHLKYQHDLVKFTQYYWESVKGYGRYLKDIDFQDLNPDAKEHITCQAFLLWRNYNVEQGRLV